jgi:acylphosphatase
VNISGVVQGVGYRYYIIRKARERNLTGWVKNRANGSVQIEAVGQRPELEELLRLIRVGPAAAHVSGVNANWYEDNPKYEEFDVRF